MVKQSQRLKEAPSRIAEKKTPPSAKRPDLDRAIGIGGTKSVPLRRTSVNAEPYTYDIQKRQDATP